MLRKDSSLDALFPKVRQALLAAMLSQPDHWWYLSDLARFLEVRPSSLQRELASLTHAGILRTRPSGNRIYYQPDPNCPLLPDLQGLLAKTAGLADIVRDAIRPFWEKIEIAFLYGSIASGEETSASDVDLMILGAPRLIDLAPALREAEKRLGRPINPAVFTPEEFCHKLTDGNHFLTTVMHSEKIFLKGSKDELGAACS
ncbi:MAG TPA: nucleotidyltransferase domain-containing protein [Chthonomonadaceae bacterium]|nr:nucleotidyltransferase domain-containing protein [Chthonomonadaceae bacterium]